MNAGDWLAVVVTGVILGGILAHTRRKAVARIRDWRRAGASLRTPVPPPPSPAPPEPSPAPPEPSPAQRAAIEAPYAGGGAWSQAAKWDEYYRAKRQVGHWASMENRQREAWLIVTAFARGRLVAPATVLDAGCGVALLPELLAYCGFAVTAVDLSPFAIEYAAQRRSDERDLTDSVMFLKADAAANELRIETDPARVLECLRARQHPGGQVERRCLDWADASLGDACFDAVVNMNGLKRATAEEQDRALAAFFRLLRPGGLLVASNQNALELQDVLEAKAAACGFELVVPDSRPDSDPRVRHFMRQPDRRYACLYWPTG